MKVPTAPRATPLRTIRPVIHTVLLVRFSPKTPAGANPWGAREEPEGSGFFQRFVLSGTRHPLEEEADDHQHRAPDLNGGCPDQCHEHCGGDQGRIGWPVDIVPVNPVQEAHGGDVQAKENADHPVSEDLSTRLTLSGALVLNGPFCKVDGIGRSHRKTFTFLSPSPMEMVIWSEWSRTTSSKASAFRTTSARVLS